MARGIRNFTEHSFYCSQCGNKGFPLMRKDCLKHEKFHKKKLYCIFCKEEVNHIECKNMFEEQEFKEDFANGVYKNEQKEVISDVWRSWVR